MAIKLMYITNNPEVALIAQSAGVDRIFVDLEYIGKEARQPGDTVKSKHTLDDVKKIRSVISKSDLLVRVNPIHENSKYEIDTAIKNGADIVMLPYFKTVDEVRQFLQHVDGRARTNLLLETEEAVECLDDILSLNGIDEIHIGLNDLHLSYHLQFMFEPLANGLVDRIINQIKQYDIVYGFGGVAQIGQGTLPAESILMEHYRLGSSMVILSRSFCNLEQAGSMEEVRNTFEKGVSSIRSFEQQIKAMQRENYSKNHAHLISLVQDICHSMENRT